MEIDLYKECIPESWREKYKIKKVERKNEEYWFYAEENEDNYPQEILNQSMKEKRPIILNGFLDRLEIVHFPFNHKPAYMHVYRRRWKLKGGGQSYHNKEELHPKGMKCTQEFGDFLKGLSRQKLNKFFTTFPDIRHIKKEDFSVVSRSSQWFHFGRKSKKTS